MTYSNNFFHNDDSSFPQGAELDALREQYDNRDTGVSVSGATNRTPGVDARVHGNSYEYDASTGSVTSNSRVNVLAHQRETIPAGHINIGGQVLSIETAINAGLIDPGNLPSAPKAGDMIDGLRYQALAQKAAEAAQANANGQQQNSNSPANNSDASLATVNAVYGRLASTLGDSGISSLETTILQNGSLPDAFASGAPQIAADAEKVIAGFVSATNKTLAPFGVTCDGLSELLTDDELYAARKAAFSGQQEALQALGREARTRLASLPDADPATFAELLEGHPAASRVSRDSRGNVTLTLDNGQRVTWGAAVQAGIVRI